MQRNAKKKKCDYSEMEIEVTGEYVQYAIDVERSQNELQNNLAACNSPKEIALATMKIIVEFYDADWCGALDVDMDLGVWTSVWWYDKEHGSMSSKKSKDLEIMENYDRWFFCMREHRPMVISDLEDIKEEALEEYTTLQRLKVTSLIAVPFWMRSQGFVALKNSRKYKEQTGLIRLLSYAIVTALNEYRLLETTKLSLTSPRVSCETDVFISLFGELKITTSKGVLTESEMKSPKISRLLVYLLLSRKVAVAPREIADAIWPEEEADMPGKNMKSLVYRLQQAFSLISDYRLIESTPNGYQINPIS